MKKVITAMLTILMMFQSVSSIVSVNAMDLETTETLITSTDSKEEEVDKNSFELSESDVLDNSETIQPFAAVSNFELDTIDGKTTYLSGELIRFGIKANLTGKNSELEKTTLEVKILKKYVSKESINASDIVNQVSKNIETVKDHHIITYILNSTGQGLSFNIPINFKTSNGDTPSGHEIPIAANLFDQNGKPLVAEVNQNFEIKTGRFDTASALIQWGYQAWTDKDFFIRPSGGYVDSEKAGFLSTNLEDLKLVEFSLRLSPDTANPYDPNDDTPGKRYYDKFKIESEIPDGAVFNSKDNPGWTYDSISGVATLIYIPSEPIKDVSEYTFRTEFTLKLKFPGVKAGATLINSMTVTAFAENKETYEKDIILRDNIKFSLEAEDKPKPIDKFKAIKNNVPHYVYDDQPNEKNKSFYWELLVSNPENPKNYPERNLENIIIEDKNLDENLKFTGLNISSYRNDVVFKGAKIVLFYEDGQTETLTVDDSEPNYTLKFDKNVKSFKVALDENSYIKPGGNFRINAITTFKKPNDKILKDKEDETRLYNNAEFTANFVDKDGTTSAPEKITDDAIQTVYRLNRYLELTREIKDKKKIYFVNDEIEHTLHAKEFSMVANDSVDTNVLIDLLPEGMEYMPGTTKTVRNNFSGYYDRFSVNTIEYDNMEPNIIKNYKGTNLTALIWKVPIYKAPNSVSWSANSLFEHNYKTKITKNLISGISEPEAYLSWLDTDNYLTIPRSSKPDVYDLNENGKTDDLITGANIDILYESPTEVSTVTNVKGNLDEKYVEKSEVGLSEIGSKTAHKYSITNNSASDLKTMYIMDLLPDVGDKTASIDWTLATPSRVNRNSTFKLRLQGPVVPPAGFDVFYTEDSIPEDIPDFTKNATWVSSVTDYSKVTAFKLVLQSGTLFKSGETRTFEVPFDIPQDTTLDSTDQAVNSFGVAIDDTLKYFESNNSTTQIVKYAMDGYVFEDENENGVFDQGTETPFSDYAVQLVDEQGVVATDLDGNPYEVMTNSDGYYAFDVYQQGTYKIKVSTPTDHVVTKEESGPLGSDITDSVKGETNLFELNRTTQKQEKNAGYHLEKGDVTIKYVNLEGELLETLTLKGQVGKDWTSSQKTFVGYKFKEVQGNVSGQYTSAAQEVTYVYGKVIAPTPIEPSTPVEPEIPLTPLEPSTPTESTNINQSESTSPILPNTGVDNNILLNVIALMSTLSGLIILIKRKKKNH